eukprot:TRINITY_DN20117_c0_g1_i1.p1 TRINITY_DN20117_c0_g1~~TRINITY_DN20117_c0_g1_i1.p1  ORF type:complete len:432 (+),score=99.39 TRINITY_DN20117_c0_g1_i1:73-1296(+)
MAGNGEAASGDAIHDRDVYIVGAARTPIGGLQGSISTLAATKLGSIAIKAAVERAGVSPESVEEVIMGNVYSAALGQAPARQAAMGAGLPDSVVCTAVNKVCASGMKAVAFGAQSIMLGLTDVVVAGGMESMSQAPYYLTKARQGYRMGHGELVDGMIKDGLWDVYNDYHMGNCAEVCSEKYEIPREVQDDHAVASYERAVAASKEGSFEWEIVPVEIPGVKGKPPIVVDKDDEYQRFDPAKMRQLKPIFKQGGTVTAANASPVSDGAAALVLVSGAKLKELSLTPLARIRGLGDAAQSPELFTVSPSLAIPKALAHAGVDKSEVEFFEINEAFSVVARANEKILELDPEKVNVNGGAVALGHPLGCSGARIIVTLLGVLRKNKAHLGVAAVCNGGGGASAIVIEAV